MTHMLCYKLILMTFGIICHGLQETPNRLLVEGRNASVLLNKPLFFWREELSQWRRTSASQHKCSIYTALFECRHIAKIERISPEFIVFLSSPADPK